MFPDIDPPPSSDGAASRKCQINSLKAGKSAASDSIRVVVDYRGIF